MTRNLILLPLAKPAGISHMAEMLNSLLTDA